MEYRVERKIKDFENKEKWPIATWNEVLERECDMAWQNLFVLLKSKGFRDHEIELWRTVWDGGSDYCQCIGCADRVQGLDYKFVDGDCIIECWSDPVRVMELER